MTNRIGTALDVNHVGQYELNVGLSFLLFKPLDFLITVCPFFRLIRTHVMGNVTRKKIRSLSKKESPPLKSVLYL